MDRQLELEIQEAIKKSLPAQVGEVLQDRGGGDEPHGVLAERGGGAARDHSGVGEHLDRDVARAHVRDGHPERDRVADDGVKRAGNR